MDDAKLKKRKPVTPRERLKNLSDALSEDTSEDSTPLTNEEKAESKRTKKSKHRRARPRNKYLN